MCIYIYIYSYIYIYCESWPMISLFTPVYDTHHLITHQQPMQTYYYHYYVYY